MTRMPPRHSERPGRSPASWMKASGMVAIFPFFLSGHARTVAFALFVKSKAGTAIAAVSTVATRKPV